MSDSYFVGIDIGTQGTKSALTDNNGNVISESFCPSVLIRPDGNTVYEDADNIFDSVIKTIRELIEKSKIDGKKVKAIGIDSQMAGIMGIDNNFCAVTPYDSWLDARCEKYTDLIKSKAEEEAIKCSGGQVSHTHASKILWWKNEQPDTYKKIKKFVMPNGYVAGKLCGLKSDKAFMDYTFLHFNVFSDNLNLKYNENLLSFFGVDKDLLPEVAEPQRVVGTVCDEFAKLCGFGNNCKVIAGCGDTAASSLGAGVVDTGLAYDVAGTASVFACSTNKFAPDIKNKTVLFSRSVFNDIFLPLSYISGGGLCLKWFSNLSQKSLKELDGLIDVKAICDTPVFIPHFSGRTYPLDNSVSGAFLKLKPKSETMEMYRSILEAIAFEYKSYFDILKDADCITGNPVVIGVGGGAKSPVFSQIKADVLNAEYRVPSSTDSAPVAMALIAAKATGYINKSLKELFGLDKSKTKVFSPNPQLKKPYSEKAKEYITLLNGYSNYIMR